MQNPPPPPPPSGPPPMMPPPPPGGGMPPMMPAGGGGYAMAAPGNLASPGMRIVGGLIDVVILVVINGIIGTILQKATGLAGVINIVIDVAYFAYFWSSRGASIGMMPFGFKVRDMATGQYPTMGKAALRGFIWTLEVGFTICIIGAVGWLWQLWDPQKQAIHDKIAGTIVTTN
jgi:RDD family